jgi:hypothetical protein
MRSLGTAIWLGVCCAGPVIASEPECLSVTTGADICAMAYQAANSPGAQDQLPHTFTEGSAAGLTAISVVADGKYVVTTIVHPLSLAALQSDLKARDVMLRTYQLELEGGNRREVCASDGPAAFVNAGGHITSVYTSADGMVFAIADIDACTKMGS